MNKIVDREFYISSYDMQYDGWRRAGSQIEMRILFPTKTYDAPAAGKIVLPDPSREEIANFEQMMHAVAPPLSKLTIYSNVLTVRAELESLKKRVAELEKML